MESGLERAEWSAEAGKWSVEMWRVQIWRVSGEWSVQSAGASGRRSGVVESRVSRVKRIRE